MSRKYKFTEKEGAYFVGTSETLALAEGDKRLMLTRENQMSRICSIMDITCDSQQTRKFCDIIEGIV